MLLLHHAILFRIFLHIFPVLSFWLQSLLFEFWSLCLSHFLLLWDFHSDSDSLSFYFTTAPLYGTANNNNNNSNTTTPLTRTQWQHRGHPSKQAHTIATTFIQGILCCYCVGNSQDDFSNYNNRTDTTTVNGVATSMLVCCLSGCLSKRSGRCCFSYWTVWTKCLPNKICCDWDQIFTN